MQQNSKNILRQKALKILSAIPFKTKIEKSKLIETKVLSLNFYKKSKAVMLFAGKSDEVQTINLIKKIIAEKDFTILPRVSIAMKRISVHKLKNIQDLTMGTYDILEPPKNYFNKKEINLILVPGLFFTKSGIRLGKGKKYYDNFLGSLRIYPEKNSALKIGLCFEKQIVSQLPCESSDIKMNYILTERRLIKCQTKN